jgi:hypothetical protein
MAPAEAIPVAPKPQGNLIASDLTAQTAPRFVLSIFSMTWTMALAALGAHCQQAIFHFGRLARRAAGFVFRNLSLAAYHRQH